MTDPESAFVPQEYSFDSSSDDDPENDLFFTRNLLNHLETKFCVNTRRIYATGLGMGGGMMHQLACHTHLSRRIGAFASVGSAFFKVAQEDRRLGQCLIGRRPIPILQIHGEDDPFYPLNKDRTFKSRSLLPAGEWLLTWPILNNCGEAVGEPRTSTSTKATVMTELEGGQLSESIAYGGAAIKTSYRCGWWPDRKNNDFHAEEKELRKIFVLQYAVRGFGEGWPRARGEPEKEVEFRGNMVKPLGSPDFDASGVIIKFFTHHRLPDKAIVHAQAKQLLYERGAKKYDEKNLKSPHNEL
jgi:poly(3-hydroxybutyrate) depolymerase